MLGKTYSDLLNEAKKMQEELRIQEEEDNSMMHQMDRLIMMEREKVLKQAD